MKTFFLSRVVLAAFAAVAIAGCAQSSKPHPSDTSASTATPQPAQPADATKPAQPTPTSPTEATAPVVVLKTSLGEIDIELDPKDAPVSTANFLSYVDKKFYDGTIFHRVIPGFMVQGGGFTADMTEKPTDTPIKNEATNGLKNLRGTISMARTNDPNSATTQFFLNLVDNAALDPNPGNPAGYAVFGKITKGLDVIDKIAAQPTSTQGQFENVPEKPITIISATRQ